MKTTKKIFAVLIALVLTISMAIPAFAGTNSITVKNTVKDETYTLYQMASLTTDEAKTTYSYTVLPAWYNFFKQDAVKAYFNFDETSGRLTAVEGIEDDSEAMINFAKLAVAYAEADPAINGTTATSTEDGSSVTFTNDDGYYVISSTLGTRAIVASNPTNKEAIIREKNEGPSLDKEVEEDSTKTFGDKNDAEVGQTVNFKVTITVKPHAKNYVMHDVMEEGLTFNTDSVKIEGLDASNYSVVTAPTDGCTFEVKFTQAYLDTITEDTKVVVTYSAVLNDAALVDVDGVENEAKLTYGDKQETEWDKTVTETHEINLLKYRGDDAEKNPLAGATFELRAAVADPENEGATMAGDVIGLVKVDDNTYRLATADDAAADIVTSFVTTDKLMKIQGLDSDTYYLRETEAPAGFNILLEDTKVVVSADETVTAEVANNAGVELPSTGGMGTTIFYAVGGVLVVAAAVVLIVRKRMGAAEEA